MLSPREVGGGGPTRRWVGVGPPPPHARFRVQTLMGNSSRRSRVGEVGEGAEWVRPEAQITNRASRLLDASREPSVL